MLIAVNSKRCYRSTSNLHLVRSTEMVLVRLTATQSSTPPHHPPPQRYAQEMRVRVLVFGVLRDHFGAAEHWVELPGETVSVAALLAQMQRDAAPELGGLWGSLAVAVNQQYAKADDPLHVGDEVALLPPVSGGIDDRVLLTREPLDTAGATAALKAGSDGAIVVFDGIVRNNTRGRQTEYLLYEAFEPMALAQMRELVAEACHRFAVRDTLLHHRLGRLEVGETSVLIAVASAHRGAAFDACRWVIDTLKKTVPIWKKEFFVDGAVWADGEAFPAELHPGEPA